MATQITHIVTADKVFPKYFSQLLKKDFYIGTTFPDIRYLGSIERDQTHSYNLNLQDIINESNSFVSGIKFHSLLDLVREDFVSKQGIYELFETQAPNKYAIPKLFEDEVLYLKIANWEVIIRFYDEILPEEVRYQIPRGNMDKWHKSLQNYFRQSPNDSSRIQHGLDLRQSQDILNLFNQGVAELRANERASEIVEEFYDNLERLLEEWQ